MEECNLKQKGGQETDHETHRKENRLMDRVDVGRQGVWDVWRK